MSSSLRESVLKLHPGLEKLIKILESSESTDPHRKSAARAKSLKDQGNACYQLKEFDEAMKFYTQSIATAPNDSQALALAYGNRSGVSWMNRNYEFCLLDTNRALITNGPLPERSIKELTDRRKKCYQKLERLNARKNSLKSRFKDLPLYDMSAKLRLFIAPSELDIEDADIPEDECDVPDDPIWKTRFDNELIPNASSKIKINYSAEYGRHLIAAKDIEPGEVLFIEEYFAVMLTKLIEARQCYCSYCTTWCEALIPCLTCTQEMYCSKRCRKMADISYHRTECKLLSFLPTPSTDGWRLILYLSLRLFLTGTRQGADLPRMMKDENIFLILMHNLEVAGNTYIPCDYLSALNLLWKDVDYSDQKDKDAGERFSNMLEQMAKLDLNLPEDCLSLHGVESAFLAVFGALKQIGFFNIAGVPYEIPGGQLSDMELFGGMLLFQNMLIIERSHGIALRALFENPYQMQVNAWALGGLVGLINHSCDPNIATIMHKRKGLTYSRRPIKEGEQIFMSYNCDYTYRAKESRQEYLRKNFHFECHCLACIEDWPLQDPSVEQEIKFLSTISSSKIREIKKMKNTLIKLLQTNSYEIDREADLKKALQFSKTVRRFVKESDIVIHACEDYIQRMMMKKGNYYVRAQDTVLFDQWE